jgi:hypothetical protein
MRTRGLLSRRWLRILAVVVALVGSTATIAAAAPSSAGTPLHRLRVATTSYHSIDAVERAGYARFTDVNGISCIAEPGMGAMGVHWVNGGLVGDPAIIPTKPEAMVYAPGPAGTLRLAAVEYIVVKSAWDATHSMAPMLYGHMFMTTDAPNRYGLPTFYSLHVWLYKHNPAGEFAMWNPSVHCPS